MTSGSGVKSYRDLIVWQKSIALAERLYQITVDFPRDELYGLTSQIRRACVSVPANIAEGYGRDMTGSYVQFLRIAQGSARELETHLILAERLGFLPGGASAPLHSDCEEICKMLRSLIRALEAR
jgi:four helix bundle protein